jgi:hypothetical protein
VIVMSLSPQIIQPEIKAILPEGDLALEPVELPPVSGVQHVTTHDEADLQLAPASAPPPPPILPSTVRRGSVQIETDREDVVKPPRNASLHWAFTSNVFEFPFGLYALRQWIISTLSVVATAQCARLSIIGFQSISVVGGSQGSLFCLITCILVLFGISYLANCFVDIIVHAAYNVDKARDWPHEDFRERIWLFLRLAWMATTVGAMGAAIAGVCSLAGNVFWPVLFVGFSLLFPILMLAGLEADSFFWPISKPIFQSVRTLWRAWAIFYAISALLWMLCAVLTRELFKHSPQQMALVAGPVWATSVFIYGRLLGRLAWFILHKGDSQQDEKAARRMAEQQRWDI